MAPQREWFEKDYYATLGVSKEASAREVTKAYRKLARSLHPDANPGDPAAEARFKEVSAAYGVIGDEDMRREYDEVRAMGPMGGFGPSSGMGGHFDLGDLFGGLFGQGGGGHASRRGPGVELQAVGAGEGQPGVAGCADGQGGRCGFPDRQAWPVAATAHRAWPDPPRRAQAGLTIAKPDFTAV